MTSEMEEREERYPRRLTLMQAAVREVTACVSGVRAQYGLSREETIELLERAAANERFEKARAAQEARR